MLFLLLSLSFRRREAPQPVFLPSQGPQRCPFFSKIASINQNKFNKSKLTLRNYDIRQSFFTQFPETQQIQ